MKENLFSSNEDNAIADRESKEAAVQTMLGDEDIDVSKTDDEKLANLLSGLGNVTTENFDHAVSEILSVMKELKAGPRDIVEALQTHLGLHLNEAKEVMRDYL